MLEFLFSALIVLGYVLLVLAPIGSIYLARNYFLGWIEDKSQVFLLIYGIVMLFVSLFLGVLAYYVLIVW